MNSQRQKVNFTLLFLSRFISDAGSAVFKFALSLYVLDVTGSAGIYSIMLALTILPGVLISIFAGVAVDKYDKKKIIIIADVLSGVGVLLICLLLFFYAENIVMFVFYVAGVSAVQAFLNLAINSSLQNIVEADQVPKVNSLFQGMGAVISIAGPLVSAVLYTYIGIQLITLVNGCAFLAGALLTSFIIFRPAGQNVIAEDSAGLLDNVKFVFRYVAERKILRFFMLTLIVLNFVYMPLTMLVMPHINYNVINVSGVQLSVIQAALGLGVISGALIVGAQPSIHNILRKFHLYLFALAAGVALWGFAALPVFRDASLWVIVLGFSLALLVVGAINTIALIPLYSFLQLEVPENLRGRVFGVATTALNIAVPVGIWLYGIVLEQTPWIVSIVFSALLLAGLGAGTAFSASFRQFKQSLAAGKKAAEPMGGSPLAGGLTEVQGG